MKNDKEYLKDIYDKYDKLKDKDNLPDFYNEQPRMRKVWARAIAIVNIVAILVVCIMSIFLSQKGGDIVVKNVVLDDRTDCIWTEGFQEAWNEVSYNYTNGPVLFEDFDNSNRIVELNNKNIDMHRFANIYNFSEKEIVLYEGGQYSVVGANSINLREEILSNKSTNSALSNSTNFAMNNMVFRDNKNELTVYSAFGEDIDLGKSFNNVEANTFNASYDKYRFFGIDSGASESIRKNIDVIFYNSPNHFAVSVKYKNEELIICRTDSKEDFEKIYEEVYEKEVDDLKFTENDSLKIPWLNVDEGIIYSDLIGKKIMGESNLTIKNIGQDVAFNLTNSNKEISEKLEKEIKGREYIFDGSFVLFLKEKDWEFPHFALRVNNTNYLVKE